MRSDPGALALPPRHAALQCFALGDPFPFPGRFRQLKLCLGVGQRIQRVLPLGPQIARGAREIIAPLARGCRDGRIGEVPGIGDAGARLLGGNVPVQLGRHAVELGDHGVDLRQPAARVVDLEPLGSDQGFT